MGYGLIDDLQAERRAHKWYALVGFLLGVLVGAGGTILWWAGL